MNNVFVFTGENDYTLGVERRRWQAEFAKKHGEHNSTTIDSNTAKLNAILDDVSVMPFLAENRLVVVDGIPKVTKEEIHMLLEQVHPSVIVLFTAAKPDKRLQGVKELLKTATIKKFDPLPEGPLRNWMQKEAQSHGATLAQNAEDRLIAYMGNNQQAIANEIAKLALYSATISADTVERQVSPLAEGVVWNITDYLSAGNKKKAIDYASQMLDRGEDAYGIWAILLSALRNVNMVRSAADAGIPASEVAKQTGIHPYALSKMQSYAKKADPAKLASVLSWSAETDVRLKTGVYRATGEAPEELDAIITLLMMKMP